MRVCVSACGCDRKCVRTACVRCVCARVRVRLASAGVLLCVPSSIPHRGVCAPAARQAAGDLGMHFAPLQSACNRSCAMTSEFFFRTQSSPRDGGPGASWLFGTTSRDDLPRCSATGQLRRRPALWIPPIRQHLQAGRTWPVDAQLAGGTSPAHGQPWLGVHERRPFVSCGRHHRSSLPAMFIMMCAARPVLQSPARRQGACTSICATAMIISYINQQSRAPQA